MLHDPLREMRKFESLTKANLNAERIGKSRAETWPAFSTARADGNQSGSNGRASSAWTNKKTVAAVRESGA